MSWLAPLGFLGFIGLIILIIIYIIKPNYQQKFISSTFVWKLSLKYRRKKIPINYLRNLLIFICQVLIISSCALILARPVIKAEKVEKFTEKVAIIDASASMWTTTSNKTRFERAVEDVYSLAEDVEKNNGTLTVILAGIEVNVLCQRQNATEFEMVYEALDNLVKPGAIACSSGEADIDGAMLIAETVLQENPETEVILYTDTEYSDKGKVKVEKISEKSEWNAAIIDVRAVFDDGYYRFEVDLAAYNQSKEVEVEVLVCGVNGDEEYAGMDYTFIDSAYCGDDEISTVTIFHEETDENIEPDIPLEDTAPVKIYSYDHVIVSIVNANDNFSMDNYYYLYGGILPTLKVQYSSKLPNPYVPRALMSIGSAFQKNNEWDLVIDQVDRRSETNPEEYATEGYDVYIFEHDVPELLPTDGLVIIINPPEGYQNQHLTVDYEYPYTGQEYYFTEAEESPLMAYFDIEKVLVTKFKKIALANDFISLAFVGSEPVILAKDDGVSQIVVFAFSLNYSNLVLFKEFPIIFANIFYNYIPATITKHVYEVYDSFNVNARGEVLSVSGPGFSEDYSEFPQTMKFSTPGVYTFSQVTLSGTPVDEYVFVKIPVSESNIAKVVDELTNPYFVEIEDVEDTDLLLYFAAALVALLFIEWILQLRENF